MHRVPMLLRAAGLVLGAAMAGCAPDAPVGPTGIPSVSAASSSRPPFVFPGGCCFYQDRMVRTVVPPASSPREGRDNFYGFSSGAAGQKGVVGVAPGDTDYHGGQWKFHGITWNVTPYLLTSETAVLAAAGAGDLTVTRIADNDFKCPIQP